MEDLISRQAAIDAILEDKIDSKSLEIMRVLGDGMQAQTLNDTCDRHAQIIKTLPSAQPDIARDIATILQNEQDMRVIARNAQERKTGKWIRIGGSEKCSVCGYTIDDEYYLGNFCQNCGAEMNRGDRR